MTIELRSATLTDLAALAEMNEQLIEDENSPNPMSRDDLQQRMNTWLDGGWSAVMILKRDAPVGYVLYQTRSDEYRPDRHMVYVRQFFLRREYRRRGIGRQAFEQVAARYFPADAPVMMEVLSANPRGLNFWESMGFETYSVMMRREADYD